MSADLDAAIRERVQAMRHNAQRRAIDAVEERDERLRQLADDAEVLADTLLAVIDAHGPHWDDPAKCSCDGEDDMYVAHTRPCPAVRAIAKALGIEPAAG